MLSKRPIPADIVDNWLRPLLDHGRRLAELLPKGRLVEIADSYTLIPEDQPAELTRAVREFLTDTA